MPLPYQCLANVGQSGVICASRGGSIFTFGADGSLLASWRHPATQSKADQTVDTVKIGNNGTEKLNEKAETSSPPSKRRKVDTDSADAAAQQITEATPAPADSQAKENGHKKKIKGRSKSDYGSVHEQPFVNILKATPDGNHIIAVTGQDKTIWVFEHDGKGQVMVQSQRSMPKRPSDIAITSDGATLLAADKFGDVYSLPLVPSASLNTGSGADTPPTAWTPKTSQRLVSKGANSLTVHSQRNLKALEDQRRHRANRQAAQPGGPTFEYDLLLGHVSMLTSIIPASSEGKPYILSADRDEHIRVSRGIPQAHVIENYCLGHTSFINAMCLPRPDILVSGGGDNELYVWNWRAGELKAKVNLLNHVQAVEPGKNKLAVSRLCSYDDGLVMVICEGIPAVFTFRVVSSGLEFCQALELLGNPLDLTILQTDDSGKPQRMVVSIDTDTTDATALEVFQMSDGNWVSTADPSFEETNVDDVNISRPELEKVIYSVENLRKTDKEDNAAEVETPTQDSELGPVPL
ncbi:WD repeat domain-containing protein [Xylariales sp. AK1849]|nr:WD repeat domain-containing protein [Xylariales sp. AK1849]